MLAACARVRGDWEDGYRYSAASLRLCCSKALLAVGLVLSLALYTGQLTLLARRQEASLRAGLLSEIADVLARDGLSAPQEYPAYLQRQFEAVIALRSGQKAVFFEDPCSKARVSARRTC